MNKVQKLAATQAHQDVRHARDSIRRLLAEEESRERSMEEVVGFLPTILRWLERAEGNMDVVLGRPRT